MIDRLFAPLLTFTLLIGGTAAITSTLFATPQPGRMAAQAAPAAPIVLEGVTIIAKRAPAQAAVSDAQAASGHGADSHRMLMNPAKD